METRHKKDLLRIIISAVLLAAAVAIEKTSRLETWQMLLVYLVPYFIAGYDVLLEALESMTNNEASMDMLPEELLEELELESE